MIDPNSILRVVAQALDVPFLSDEQRRIIRDRLCQGFSAEVLSQVAAFQNMNVAPDLSSLTIRELKALASEREIPGYGRMKKPELVAALAEVGSAHPTATLQADRA